MRFFMYCANILSVFKFNRKYKHFHPKIIPMSFFGISLTYNDTRGNHYVARTKISKGSIIFRENFLIAHPVVIKVMNNITKMVESVSRCGNWKCWKPLSHKEAYICKKCNYTMFCNEKCYSVVKQIHDKV